VEERARIQAELEALQAGADKVHGPDR
jgi:hypothetical protein